jgi:hypothetical protein
VLFLDLPNDISGSKVEKQRRQSISFYAILNRKRIRQTNTCMNVTIGFIETLFKMSLTSFMGTPGVYWSVIVNWFIWTGLILLMTGTVARLCRVAVPLSVGNPCRIGGTVDFGRWISVAQCSDASRRA